MSKTAYLKRFLGIAEEARAFTANVPDGFDLVLQKAWVQTEAASAMPEPDFFLLRFIQTRCQTKKTFLFLSDFLIGYLNAPVDFPAALPFTRLMRLVFKSLDQQTQQQFQIETQEGALRFYQAFAGDLPEARYLPALLISPAVHATLQEAGLAAEKTPGPLCAVVTERDFLETAGDPQAEADAANPPAITLIGPADLTTGIGAALRYMADGLEAAKVPFAILNRYPNHSVAPGDKRYARHETLSPTAPINLMHFNSEVLAENILVCGPKHIAGRYNIGSFYWETSHLPRVHHLNLHLIDEIWVASQFLRSLYAKVTDKPIYCMGSVVNPPQQVTDRNETRRRFGLPTDAFLFIFTYNSLSTLSRKNPLGVLKAFMAAFPHDADVHLVFKTQYAEKINFSARELALFLEMQQAFVGNGRLHFINATLSVQAVDALLACCDAYVSLHRCEGFGYGMAEAMAVGLPVIATHWSGNVDFTNHKTAYPISATPVRIVSDEYPYAYEPEAHYWVEPSQEEAIEAMRGIVRNRAKAAAIGKAGQAFIQTHYSAAAVGAKMKARIAAITDKLQGK